MNVVSVREAANIIARLNLKKDDKYIEKLARRFRNALIREADSISIMNIQKDDDATEDLLVVEWGIIDSANNVIYVGFDLEEGRIVMRKLEYVIGKYSYDSESDSHSISSVKFKGSIDVSTEYKGINRRHINEFGQDILSYSDYETLKEYVSEEQSLKK